MFKFIEQALGETYRELTRERPKPKRDWSGRPTVERDWLGKAKIEKHRDLWTGQIKERQKYVYPDER